MDEDRKDRTERYDHREDYELLQLTDDYRVHDLGTHFEFERESEGSSEVDHDVHGLPSSQLTDDLCESLQRADYDNKYADELKPEHGDLRNVVKNASEYFHNFSKWHNNLRKISFRNQLITL